MSSIGILLPGDYEASGQMTAQSLSVVFSGSGGFQVRSLQILEAPVVPAGHCTGFLCHFPPNASVTTPQAFRYRITVVDAGGAPPCLN